MTDKPSGIARSALDAITNSAGTRTGQMIHLDVEQWDFVRRLLKDHVEGKHEAALERVRAEIAFNADEIADCADTPSVERAFRRFAATIREDES